MLDQETLAGGMTNSGKLEIHVRKYFFFPTEYLQASLRMSLLIDIPPQAPQNGHVIFQLFIAFDHAINDQRSLLNNISNIMRRAKVCTHEGLVPFQILYFWSILHKLFYYIRLKVQCRRSTIPQAWVPRNLSWGPLLYFQWPIWIKTFAGKVFVAGPKK